MRLRASLPESVRRRAINLGAPGERWLDELDALVAALARDWSLQLGEVLQGGTEALVLSAVRSDGEPAVLKLGLPGSSELALEARVLEIAEGRGYATLLGLDASRGAMLLERLGPTLASLDLPPDAQMHALALALMNAWQPLAATSDFMTGADKAIWLGEFITEGQRSMAIPFSTAVIDAALSCAEKRRRAHRDDNIFLVHGDAHAHNALLPVSPQPSASACRFVDPDGLCAEREYDLGIVAREWQDDVFMSDPVRIGRIRCAELARLTAADADAIWQWGLLERVSTAQVCMTMGMQDIARRMLAGAAAWAAAR